MTSTMLGSWIQAACRVLPLALAAAVVLRWQSTPAWAEDGKALLTNLGCVKCHAVSVEGIASTGKPKPGKTPPPDLSGAGARHPADWLRQFIQRTATAEDGKKHKVPFKGTDAQLAALVDYLSGLKTPAPAAK